MLAIACDPLFFYLPSIVDKGQCLGLDPELGTLVITLRTVVDVFYVLRIVLQFRTAYIAPSSRVYGRGELVIDPAEIAKRYLRGGLLIVDFLSILPLPQILVLRYNYTKNDVWSTKTALLHIILLQYIPRFIRIFPLTSELKRTVGVFIESAFAGAIYYLVLYILSSHILGSVWYLLAIERNDTCWKDACKNASHACDTDNLYCGSHENNATFVHNWLNFSKTVIHKRCSTTLSDNKNDPPLFEYGIYKLAVESGILSSDNFVSKYFYCLWWGLQNLSTLGQGLQTSTFPGEIIFSISIAVFGLIIFALLIGNMQTYLQSLTVRLEEMRVQRRDSEQWMHHRSLPQDLRERVRRYDQYRWVETRGVDEESLVQSLPKDLRRDIKRHLCLALVRRVPLFANMDERLLDAICERLKPSLFIEGTHVVREGDPVDEMLFIIRGRLESETTDGGRSGFYNQSLLKEGDFCGEELLTWALDPKTGSNLPSSTRTVKALSEVETFALSSEELKFVAGQFRRLHSRQVQQTFRFYSQQWRTWAACFIQAAWRRCIKRKILELRRREGEEGMDNSSSSSFAATIYASRFATNALRRIRSTRSVDLVRLQKPHEPDFNADDAE
ncbi:Cyclic nucleotide-gated ion channel protein [Thalictrum thalictroides]|uniref:Cyclic nucleotide-gated ion channel protein n=1 Tax=Thalictrum thalictroides TaxID=46969 RepID=A0A7J6XDT4_THATH|nr:Cyclic nucleotide-gated ion channel protein [Thalictrum thalictroides]